MKFNMRVPAFACAITVVVAAGCGSRTETETAAKANTSVTEAHEGAEHQQAAGHKARWSYEEGAGPGTWAELSPDYALCGSGQEQSPINISNPQQADSEPLSLQYEPASLRIIKHEHVVDIIDNGHTIQVNYDEGSVLNVGGLDFGLAQYHFHAPSEHTINGRHAPMEMHLVHASADGQLAVLAVLIAQGEHNTAFDPLWANLPDEPGDERHYEHIEVNIGDLLPKSHRVYRYMGSLTTPPCSEGVRWFVAVEQIQLSAQQLATFTSILDNINRPVQSLNQRSVKVDAVPQA